MLMLTQGCGKKDYGMGELTAPTDVVINTTVVGQDATHPNGDGSGDVAITLTGKNVLAGRSTMMLIIAPHLIIFQQERLQRNIPRLG